MPHAFLAVGYATATASSRPAGGSAGRVAPGWPAPACHPGNQVGIQARHRRQPPGDRPRRQPRLPVGQPYHAPVTALMGQELEHICRGHFHPGSCRSPRRTPSNRTPPPAACSVGTARHELQIPVHQPLAQAIADLARPPKRCGQGTEGCSSQHRPSPASKKAEATRITPCIKRYARSLACYPITLRADGARASSSRR
jgi:hypothetical protein